MSAVKRIWFTQHEAELHAISIESKNAEPEFLRVKVSELNLPSSRKQGYGKLRHVVVLKLFSIEDLEKIHKMIGQYLEELREDQ